MASARFVEGILNCGVSWFLVDCVMVQRQWGGGIHGTLSVAFCYGCKEGVDQKKEKGWTGKR